MDANDVATTQTATAPPESTGPTPENARASDASPSRGILDRIRERGPARTRRMSTDAWMTVLVGVGVVGGLALGFLLGSLPSAADRTVSSVARPVTTPKPVPTVTVTATYMMPPSAPPNLAARERPSDDDGEGRPNMGIRWETGGIDGHFDHVGTLNSSTSKGFARSVAAAYNASGAQGGSTRISATSDATGKRVTMTCSPRRTGAVVCRGGQNARVVLWR